MTIRHLALKEKPSRRKTSSPTLTVVPAVANPTPVRWTCHHHLDSSDIEAFVPKTDGIEIIAQTRAAEGIDARANAELITRAVNNYETTQSLIANLVAALELCLTCEGLSWEAEQEAELVIKRTVR